jgi:hypothetical protein
MDDCVEIDRRFGWSDDDWRIYRSDIAKRRQAGEVEWERDTKTNIAQIRSLARIQNLRQNWENVQRHGRASCRLKTRENL